MFLSVRCSSHWESQIAGVRKWIGQTPKRVAAVA